MLLAFSALALAQPSPAAVACRSTETQAECHARLKCKATEDLEDCKKRLLRCRADEELEACERRVARERGAGQREPADDDRTDDRRDDDRRDDARDDDRDRRDRDDDRRGRDDDDRGERRGRADDDDRGERRRRDDRGERRRRGGRRGDRGGGGFVANKTFGLGIELGEPSGLTGKYFFSDSTALDFGVGWIYSHYYYGDGVHLYGDVLWHPTSLVSADAFELPFYVGVGLRFWEFDYCDRDFCYDGSAIGVRVPLGLAFDFNNVPLDIFVQLVPVLDFIDGDYYDRYDERTHLGVDLSVGLRYWFK